MAQVESVPAVGRIVHYLLTADDVGYMNSRGISFDVGTSLPAIIYATHGGEPPEIAFDIEVFGPAKLIKELCAIDEDDPRPGVCIWPPHVPPVKV